MVRSHARKEPKLQTKRRCPMRVKAKLSLMFIVSDLINAQQLTVQAQIMVPYPVIRRSNSASEGLCQQVEHFDTTYHLVDEIKGVRKRKGSYEVTVKWLGFDDDEDMTWDPIDNIRDDLPGILEDFLYTPKERNLKRKTIDLYF